LTTAGAGGTALAIGGVTAVLATGLIALSTPELRHFRHGPPE